MKGVNIKPVALSLALLSCVALGGLRQAVAMPVDVNSADEQTLASAVVGVGPAKARAIIAYRDAHGPFRSLDELSAVQGIGERLLEQIRDQLSIGPGGEPTPAKPASDANRPAR
ncbi:MAG: helix-hairpin-helix domain-containing protein [Gammaproteobacteria bacterium]|nr:helix-hairpin-helix domain-containing protein [Gammaproteobacteria bacterium]